MFDLTGKTALGADASAKVRRAIAKMFQDLAPGR